MSAEPLRQPSASDEVAAYYDAKTEGILQRYGPGPRVHYHIGLVDDTPPPGLPAEALRTLIHDSQELTMRELALDAGMPRRDTEVLDVGCGLGGSSLYWASVHRARVTALTNVPAHVPWVNRFAAAEGVADRVNTVLGDALELPGKERFDLVVAVESSCYLPRREWFRRVHSLLRPGGLLAISDCFLGRPELAGPFNQYWRAQIGSVEEYFRAAAAEGLELELHQDISGRAVNFWTLTLDLLARERSMLPRSRQEFLGRSESQRQHLRLQQAFLDGGLHYAMMILRRPD
jgi:cyclopropane fatty-acyl-phospholipid synthase-like methyltransferase